MEAESAGGKYVKASDLFLFDWKEGKKTLFIDGLDEMRANGGDGRIPLDQIREHLKRLGCPDFRISCREADWLGSSDREALKFVSPDNEVVVLHLDPLTDDDVVEILHHKPAVSDPEGFIRKAKQHRLEELLRNPQTLNLLVNAVSENAWPESRQEVYEMACRQLARDISPEHRQAKREKNDSVASLLDAAGYLCAVQMLSGKAGFSLDEEASSDPYIYWKDLNGNRLPLLEALKSNLFTKDVESCFTPVHRSVSEYLGARHLAGLIGEGLPLGRLLALMTGEDGGVVSDLRGLAAWLAVHSLAARRTLIERDPLAVVLYGDVRNFSVQDKKMVFEQLEAEAGRYPWFRNGEWNQASFGTSFGALATKDMTSTFREILVKPMQNESDQVLSDCVLDALQYGDAIAELADVLEAVARNRDHPDFICRGALRALFRAVSNEKQRFLNLADDILKGVVEDRDDEMLGILLQDLYPGTISPERLFDFFHIPKQSNLTGRYATFWRYILPEIQEKQHLLVFLDRLAKTPPSGADVDRYYHYNQVVVNLLAEGLEVFGDEVETARLYDWLGVGLDEYGHPREFSDNVDRIRNWLSVRPGRIRGIIAFCASRCAESENAPHCMHKCMKRLYGATAPRDLWEWYMQQSKDHQGDLSKFFFDQALRQLMQQGGQQYLTPEAIEMLNQRFGDLPEINNWLEPPPEREKWRLENENRRKERERERQERRNVWREYVRKNLDEIRFGSAHPNLFHDLAFAYLGRFYNIQGNSPDERLADLLGEELDLIEAVHCGFRNVLKRHDIPAVDEILKLSVKERVHPIYFPCKIGIEELYRSDPSAVLGLEEGRLSSLLAFHFVQGMGSDPEWVKDLIKLHPELFANVLVSYELAMLKKGRDYVTGAHQLAHEDAYSEVAKIALPSLFEGFPLRARKNQIFNILIDLMRAGLKYLDREFLASLVARKLETKMLAVQRIGWLCLGVLLRPERYANKLFDYVENSQLRREQLAGMLYAFGNDRNWLQPVVLPKLIEMLAPDYPPRRPFGVHTVTVAMNHADMVGSFIDILGGHPDENIHHELERMASLPSLSGWKNHLLGALHAQRIAMRKASFRPPGVGEICLTLENLQPANSADLAALTLENLREIAGEIRDGNTDDYRQYWSYGEKNKQLDKPKPENDCRNALLSDLKVRLSRYGIDAQPEGNYAESKRADIRVSFGGKFNVPIEIKKDSHEDVWKAIHDQLIPKYVRDPGTGGYGIYLVFWFGGKNLKRPPDGSRRPSSATELEERLRQQLSPEESHRISVCVVDCALPPAANFPEQARS